MKPETPQAPEASASPMHPCACMLLELLNKVYFPLRKKSYPLCSYALAYIDIGVVHAFAAQTNVKKNKRRQARWCCVNRCSLFKRETLSSRKSPKQNSSSNLQKTFDFQIAHHVRSWPKQISRRHACLSVHCAVDCQNGKIFT